jgi:DNA polymerase-1
LDIIKKNNPEYIAVAFDPPSRTFRHTLYPDYKANRLSTPEVLKQSIQYVKKILSAIQIQVIEIEGFEADDVIGTLAKRAEYEGLQIFMVTPDKDYMQLVTEQIKICKPSKAGNEMIVLGRNEVNKIFGVQNPGQVIEVLALWGDSSDNIPGAPGIGEKTAKELISQYQTVDNLYLHLNELKERIKESLLINREQVLMSHKLATIHTDVPLLTSIESLKTKPWDKAKLLEIFSELEFKTLIDKLLILKSNYVQGTLFEAQGDKSPMNAPVLSSCENVSHNYRVVETEDAIEEIIQLLSKSKEFCLDSETTGLNTRHAELVGLAFSNHPHIAYYVPIPVDLNEACKLLEKFKVVLENPGILKVGQNLKFDIGVLSSYQIQLKGELFDTMIAHYLLSPDARHNLEYLAETYLQYKMISKEQLIGSKGDGIRSMREVELSSLKEYAGENADITWQLYLLFKDKLQLYGMHQLSRDVEMPLTRVLADIEATGFSISKKSLESYKSILKIDLQNIEKEIYTIANMKFNINSPKQLGEVLFERMKIAEGTQKSKSKQYSTGEEVLQKLAKQHPIVNLILDYRGIQKLLNTYVETLPELVDSKTSKVHTFLDQAWVSTGRLSSRNPNLQNIPVKDKRGKEIRKAFIPSSKNHVLLSADYSQIELRIMAHLSEDPNMIAAFKGGEDIHISTAAKIFRVNESDVTSFMRNAAKTANFGIIYGISAFGLSQRLDISRSDAAQLIQGYFENFPGVKEFMDRAIQKAREKGYAETIMGRRRMLPDIQSANSFVRGMAERNAINAPIQGSAADIIKLAMVKIHSKLDLFKTRMILQVHDELIFDVWKDELDEVKTLVKYEMEKVVNLKVPLLVEIGIGNNWLEAH